MRARLAHAKVVNPAAQTRRDEDVAVTIVGVGEANMAEGKISIGSLVVLAPLGARVGDKVRVRTPRGPAGEVTSIRYPRAPRI